MTQANITDSPNKRMTGVELRRLRTAAGLSCREVAERLGTYRLQIQRWEARQWFELHPVIMQQLLTILGVDSHAKM